ncbi:adenylate/guanylate cyclase domain-containing protein [Mycobacterium sp. ITM-2016-00318]|uniref:ATP-binding protein n=1 Tax=Mycobacterium sp. ITM-2016-00318 TaxID=2099693 RepID=UPI000CFA4663|nr:adenylate/guanylate cyclase domain-containing protein [Mycobacterium sp. ITM-2016-00318]WNG95074.1 adenylate/guanylate cyclase domain-containing protein [Mycobacterium sp. ITM-2016-00318]
MTALRDVARFCDNCGTAFEPSQQTAEYKQVTVLFADVVRSMDIAATLGPERLRELMTELVERSGSAVRRFGGTVNQFTGDGFMALFGAPVAMEDHAVRACLAALDVQAEARSLANDFEHRYGVALKLRVGLNSGEVVAGDIGSGPMGYTVSGRHVGMAQRMESTAPPGGVMISESTARLVESVADLGDPEPVRIKGSDEPVLARRLLTVHLGDRWSSRRESPLVGRSAELTRLTTVLERAIAGDGYVVGIVGPPGIGKSRVTRELLRIAGDRQLTVIKTYCESHFKDIPFHVAARFLRGFFGVVELDSEAAREKLRSSLPDADPNDILLLDDLLGIRDAEQPAMAIDPDARRRRVARLLETVLVRRRTPAIFVIEDAHWIDTVSESMLAELVAVISKTPSLVLVTHRPEYHGALTGMTSISLAPLDRAEASTLTAELLGSNPTLARLSTQIAERSGGNPFFTEEMVRDLVERRVIGGERGAYICLGDGDVAVPATVQATIAARVDRLDSAAKRTLNAASVIGTRFSRDLLAEIIDDDELPTLIDAELIEPVTDSGEFAFRHPLLRAVAYESQLRAGRAVLHRRIADAIEQRDAHSVDANAALIATHLESAGDLRAAFDWHMRAGGWSTHRDIRAARMSWQRAVGVADEMPAEAPERPAMRIAPRTLLCATIWRVGGELADVRFDELRELAMQAGDNRSMAMGMTGLIQMLNFHGRFTEASDLATEYVSVLESFGDPELTVAMLLPPILTKWNAGEIRESLRLCEYGIELSGGDPSFGALIIGSPLAFMLALRASARCCFGIPGWRDDFDQAVDMARKVDQFSFCGVVQFKYISVLNWALEPDDEALRETTEALDIARHGADDFTLVNAEFAHGLVLVRRDDTDRDKGFELLAKAARLGREHRYTIIAAWCADLDVAAEKIRLGDLDSAVQLAHDVLEEELNCGEHINIGWATTVLVEALLHRGHDEDVDTAAAAVDRLASMPVEGGFVYHELPLMRLTALLAKARGEDEKFRLLWDRYRARAVETELQGHIALARAMD